MKQSVVIIDYGVGNTYSVSTAISFLGHKVRISDKESIIKKADAIILPGVGAFDEAMRNLKNRKLDTMLGDLVLNNKKPLLGICVGMQMLMSCSEENGLHSGLGWIEGKVTLLKPSGDLRVPQVGWNNVHVTFADPVFSRCQHESNFYFDHSYSIECENKYVAGYCEYSGKVVAAVRSGNIIGVQFHPEKSQNNGLRLFKGFLNSI